MSDQKFINLIEECLEKSDVDLDGVNLNINTELIEEGILDSLDAMTFLFQLEKKTR